MILACSHYLSLMERLLILDVIIQARNHKMFAKAGGNFEMGVLPSRY